jgi:hypothetical protein
MAPWAETLFDEFIAAFGYDLVDRLPELFLQLNGEPVSQVKWHYMEMLQRLFLQNFAKPMYNGVRRTGCNSRAMCCTKTVSAHRPPCRDR